MCVCQASVTPLTGLSQVSIETDGDVAYQGGGKEGVRSGAWGKVGNTVTPEDERCFIKLHVLQKVQETRYTNKPNKMSPTNSFQCKILCSWNVQFSNSDRPIV